MEPITLCGLVIVIFGFWIELEELVKTVARLIQRSSFVRIWTTMVAVEHRPVCGNRYVPYPS